MTNDDRIRRLGGEGILTEDDARETAAGTMRVLELMLDGAWYSAPQICAAAGDEFGPASEGLRRMRELRQRGYRVERKHIGRRTWHYRLVEA
jgi:hypothetical protein